MKGQRVFVGRGLGISCLVALLAALAPLGTAQKSQRGRVPTLMTDLPDYGPGNIVVLTGTGFLFREDVTMQILHADGTPSDAPEHDPWMVRANDNGSFIAYWLVPETHCIGTFLVAKAAGSSSGMNARVTFMDSHDCGTGIVTSVTPVGGSCSAFTPAQGNGPDNYEVEEGGVYTMTIEGVTECSGDTITVFVQSSSSGNFCFNASGIAGSGTYVGTFQMPDPACNTMPVSYKCGANAPCNHPNSYVASGPSSGCGGVHLRTATFDGSCGNPVTDTNCDPTGACCLPDGSCTEATEADCLAAGGTYNGDDTECAGVTCPQPPGACCLVDGTCIEVTEEDCIAAGGTFNGDGTFCVDADCPVLAGACCLEDGSCVQVTADECAALGGTFDGQGTLCIDADCPQPLGSCCLVDGTCVEVTEEDCLAIGGTYNGDNTLCVDADCPPAAGACCLADGSCVQVTEDDCLALGGTYNGDLTLCMDADCPQPTGACCLPDGSCVEETEEDCEADGGAYNGDGTTCGGGGVTCSPPVGACCLADGTCVVVNEADCLAIPGIWNGPGSTCDDAECEDTTVICYTVDFETDDDGNPMPHGAHVDVEFDCGGAVFPVAITGSANPSGNDTTAILDSTNGPAAQDPDLMVSKGNILILQNDGNQSQCPANSGVYCSHNDDENGGTLSFAFCVPVTPTSIALIDIDGTDGPSTIVLTDVNGKTRTFNVPGNWTGDRVANFPAPGWQTLSLNNMANQAGFASVVTASEQAGFDPSSVVQLDVNLSGSGGVDDLTWCQ